MVLLWSAKPKLDMYQISPVEVASASFICTVKRLYETVYNKKKNKQQKMTYKILFILQTLMRINKVKWSLFKKNTQCMLLS